jgi:flavin reductase (DIM6/NTAB) family NADH-FMN oxidoreductase RutF
MMINFNPPEMEFEEVRRLAGSIVVPRPIFLISTASAEGHFNVAPFSLVTSVCYKPLLLGISILRKHNNDKKDTLRYIEESREFVAGLVQDSIMEKMNIASRNYPPDIDEFKESGLTPVKADIVKVPMVAECPISMECRLVQVLEFGSSRRLSNFVIGEVARIHIKDEIYTDNRIMIRQHGAMGNMGGDYYCRTVDNYKMPRKR